MRMLFHRLPLAASLCGLAVACAAASAADAREDVFRAYQKMMDARFAVDIITLSGSDTIKSHGDYDTVERIHFKNDKIEMIVVPEGDVDAHRQRLDPAAGRYERHGQAVHSQVDRRHTSGNEERNRRGHDNLERRTRACVSPTTSTLPRWESTSRRPTRSCRFGRAHRACRERWRSDGAQVAHDSGDPLRRQHSGDRAALARARDSDLLATWLVRMRTDFAEEAFWHRPRWKRPALDLIQPLALEKNERSCL